MRATIRLGLAFLLASPGPASAALVVSPIAAVPSGAGLAGASAASVAGLFAPSPTLPLLAPSFSALTASPAIVAAPVLRPDEAASVAAAQDASAQALDAARPFEPAPEPLPPAAKIAYNGREFPSSVARPNEPIEPHVVAAIDAARQNVRMAVYDFNQPDVLAALRRAKNERGVKVEVVLDRGHVYTTGRDEDGVPLRPDPLIVELINEAGFDVVVNIGSGIQHNKFLIVDEGLVEFGTYNYSLTSENEHYEEAFFRTEKERVDGYLRYFEYLRKHSESADRRKLEDAVTRAQAVEAEAEGDDDFAPGPEGLGPRAFDLTAGPLAVVEPPPQDAATPIALHEGRFPLQLFSPKGGIEAALVRAIDSIGPQETIHAAHFSLSSKPIIAALLRARERGAEVHLVLFNTMAKLAAWFAGHDIDVRLSDGPNPSSGSKHQKMHLKNWLFNGQMLAAGSFNPSTRADAMNRENINFFNDAVEISRFAAFFAQIYARGRAPKPSQ